MTKQIILTVLALILLDSCTPEIDHLQTNNSDSHLFERRALNLDEGYEINPISKDTIQPIITSLGDTVQTGKAFSISPKKTPAQLKENRSYLPLGQPDTAMLKNTGRFITPSKSVKYTFDRSSLNNVALGSGINKFITNDLGDTIITGKKIRIKAKITQAINRPKTPVSAPKFKENAQANISILDVDQGLTSSYIYSIIEDNLNQMWLGTYGNGIMMFDGNSIQSYTTTEGLGSNLTRKLFKDSKGNIWIGSEDAGLTKFDGKQFFNYHQNEGFLGKNVYDILEDRNGNIWCATNQGVSKFDGEKFTHYSQKEGLSSRIIWSICEDSKGKIWMGNDNGVVSCFNGSKFIEFGEDQYILPGSILDITEDSQGNIWLSSMGAGVYQIKGNTIIDFGEEGMTGMVITSITMDKNQNLWFTSIGDGIYKYDGTKFQQFTENFGLSKSDFWMMHNDPSGSLWFGSEGGGISIIRDDSFEHLTTSNGLKSNSIWALEKGDDNEIWISNLREGLIRMKNNKLEFWDQSDNLSSNNILSILHDSKKNLWLGSWGKGVDLCADGQVTNFNSENGLGSDVIFSIMEDNSGSIWFSTGDGGAVRFDGKTFYQFSEKQGLGGKNVRSVFEDSKGNFWFATAIAGAVKYDGKNLTHYTEKEGLSSNAVRCIEEDKMGNIWIGTDQGGLSIFTGTEFIQVGKNQGLTNNNIRTIDKTRDDLFIIGTEKGLNLVKLELNKKNEFSVNISTLEKQDGLKGVDFFLNTSCINDENRIFWSTGKALTSIDINNLSIPHSTPNVTISSLEINDTFLDFTTENPSISYQGTPAFQNIPLDVIFNHDQNHLTFHFSGTDWKSPQSIQYSHRLNDAKWSRPSSEPKVDYRNLNAGKYSLEVRARGSNLKWGNSQYFQFEISPPWWKMWWAYSLYVLLIAGGIYAIYRYQLKRQLALNEAQRLREMSRIKTEFFTNISHEFRTPLTIINGLKERLSNNYNKREDEAFNKNVNVLHRNSDQLLNLVNQLLDISKLEQGAIELKIEALNLDRFVRKELSSYASSADQKHISLHVDCPNTALTLLADKKLFKSIFHNIIGNALKFTNDGSITVRVAEKNSSFISVAIVDTGIGIPSTEIDKVFDRFYQVDKGSAKEFEGTGIGLAHVKQLVDLHSANIRVSSELGVGTTFELIFPRGADLLGQPSINKIDENTEWTDDFDSQNIDTKPKLLIVEDNADMRYFISLTLEDEYIISTANDGLEGIKLAQELVPDFIISDWMMPQMTGPEMLQELRRNVITSHIPMMLLTARADQNSKIEGYRHGADAYLVKPFESEELKLRIKVLIDARNRLQAYYSDVKTIEHSTNLDRPKIEDAFILKTLKYIQINMSDSELSGDSIAAQHHISRSQFARKLKTLTDKSVTEFIRIQRLSKAKELLSLGDLNVSEVAFDVGFSDPAYFTRVFTKEFGVSPTNWRDSN